MPAPALGQCGLCNAAVAKYKCPSCLVPYCSLACYKPHKLSHAAAEPTPSSSSSDTTTPAASSSAVNRDTTSAPLAAAPAPTTPVPPTTTPPLSASDQQKALFAAILSDPEVVERLKSSPRLRFKMKEVARVEKDERAKEVLNGARKDAEVEELMQRILQIVENEKKEV